MREKTLLIISAITILLGLPTLIILSVVLAHTLDNPENILLEQDPHVFFTGKVIKITRAQKVTVMTIKYSATIPLVSFEETDIKQGDIIKVNGVVETYKGKKQVRAEKINKI